VLLRLASAKASEQMWAEKNLLLISRPVLSSKAISAPGQRGVGAGIRQRLKPAARRRHTSCFTTSMAGSGGSGGGSGASGAAGRRWFQSSRTSLAPGLEATRASFGQRSAMARSSSTRLGLTTPTTTLRAASAGTRSARAAKKGSA
jgi:hypothetical protein